MKRPIIIYDNLCKSCTSYAKYVDKILRGKITMIGHYTKEGEKIKSEIFPDNYKGLEMSWFVTENHAYGGRKGLEHILRYMLKKTKREGFKKNQFDFSKCDTGCSSVKGVLFRSGSILTRSKVIPIKKTSHIK